MTLMAQLRTRDLLDSLGREDEQPIDREIELDRNQNQGVERLVKVYKSYSRDWPNFDDGDRALFDKIMSAEHLSVTSKNIETFSLLFPNLDPNYYERYLGRFLSLCINRCEDAKITIHTAHLEISPDCLGMYNAGKYIVVRGNAAHSLGSEMSGGTVEVTGDVIGILCGLNMTGGEIIVRGDIKIGCIGTGMKGGRIHVYGEMDTGSIQAIRGAKIYHKNRLIFQDGRILK